VKVSNVASYRGAAKVPVEVPGVGKVCGDMAWGGNWFFLIDDRSPAQAGLLQPSRSSGSIQLRIQDSCGINWSSSDI